MSITPGEKEKLVEDMKDKANKFKADAEGFAAMAKDYFEEFKTKAGEALKDNSSSEEKRMNDLFGKNEKTIQNL